MMTGAALTIDVDKRALIQSHTPVVLGAEVCGGLRVVWEDCS